MHTPVALLVLCSALVFSEVISAMENFRIRRPLLVFRGRIGDVADLGRLFAAIVLVLSFVLASDEMVVVSLIILSCGLLIETIFDPFGLDAGRHASLFLCIGLALSVPLFTRPIGYAFILINMLAMYAWSSLFKMKSPAWRRGEALPNVLASRGYGLNRWPPGPNLNARAYWALSWAFMLAEISIVAAFVLNSHFWSTAIVVLLAIFHVSTGVLMGLRRFSHAGLVGCCCLLVIQSEYPSVVTLLNRVFRLLI